MSDTYRKQPPTKPLPRTALAPIKREEEDEPVPPTLDRCPICGGQGCVTKEIKVLADDVLREIQRRKS